MPDISTIFGTRVLDAGDVSSSSSSEWRCSARFSELRHRRTSAGGTNDDVAEDERPPSSCAALEQTVPRTRHRPYDASDSMASRRNSVNSSRKSTSRCASVRMYLEVDATRMLWP